MQTPDEIRQDLSSLKIQLEQVNRAWRMNEYDSLLKFYIRIVPGILEAELCSIFLVEPTTGEIWLKYSSDLKEKDIIAPREGSVVGDAITSGKWVIANDLHKRSGYHAELASKTKFITRNLICAPIKSLTGKGISGAIEVLNKRGGESFSEEDAELLQEVANYLSMAIDNIVLNQEIVHISNQLNRRMDQLWQEDIQFIAKSRVMQNVLSTVRVASETPVNVLLLGESGTGKEVLARMIHKGSSRREKPFISVNCASIPDNLMESEFFGYEKGAFTGAVSSKKGRFEDADGGILFLDEIGDMPKFIQPKFLRVLQEGEGHRLGSGKTIRYDVRIISATNKDLRKEVENGLFREDLFYRIFSVEIHIPPLRERREDIIPLAALFADSVSKRFSRKIAAFSSEVLNLFEEYPWPGNVRQLLHEVERLVALTPEGDRISLTHCSPELQGWKSSRSLADTYSGASVSLPEKVKNLEIQLIREALRECSGNKLQASKALGITRQGLDKKIKRYEIANSAKTRNK
jgi:transcriptional regulator with GAF, ATPase, and Fis domain